jgi:hypothetical protein
VLEHSSEHEHFALTAADRIDVRVMLMPLHLESQRMDEDLYTRPTVSTPVKFRAVIRDVAKHAERSRQLSRRKLQRTADVTASVRLGQR